MVNQLCEWFDENAVFMNEHITKPELFTDSPVSKRFDNVLIENKKYKTNIKFGLFENKPDVIDKFIISHKYQINFSKEQSNIILNFFYESTFLYNFCVSIWEEYNEVTDNWLVLKGVIFDFLYRDGNGKQDLNKTRKAIIERLKIDRATYMELQLLDEEKNKPLRDAINLKFKNEMKQYKLDLIENEKLIVKKQLIKPKRDKFIPIKTEMPKIEQVKRRENIDKPAPDDTLKYEIQEFCVNLKNNRKKAFEEKINFVLTRKEVNKTISMLISTRCLGNDGICVRKLGKLECSNYKYIIEHYQNTIKDSKLFYDVILKRFYLSVAHEVDKVVIENRNEVVAIDEGEKTFLAFYSNNENGKMGDNMRKKILPIKRKIAKMKKTLEKNKNKNGKSIKNKRKIIKRIRKEELKIVNYRQEVHRKAALYLCENYENILLPEFNVKQMIKNKPNNKLPKWVKEVMVAQGHYMFKRYLKYKGMRYRTNIYDVNEAYTSQTCSNCGCMSKIYDNKRLKTCPSCKYQIDRDINGSKNILLKCVTEMGEIYLKNTMNNY